MVAPGQILFQNLNNEDRFIFCCFLVFHFFASDHPSPQVVIGDLGCVEIADPHVRLQKKFRPGDTNIYVCTPNYRPPDVWLGSQQYEADLDMWSFGCVAAEIYSRQVLINPAVTAKNVHGSIQFLEAVAAIVSTYLTGDS